MRIIPSNQLAQFKIIVSPGYALDPQLLLDGTYCIPEIVLSTTGYSAKWPNILSLVSRAVLVSEFPWYEPTDYPYPPTQNAETIIAYDIQQVSQTLPSLPVQDLSK